MWPLRALFIGPVEPTVPAGAAGCAELGHGVLAGAGAVVAVGIAVDWAWLAEAIDGPAAEGTATEPQPETPRPQITTNLARAIRPINQPLQRSWRRGDLVA